MSGQKAALQAIALNAMIPGRNEQIKFVKRYQPKVITLTMGANDVGFAEKMESCVANTNTCKWVEEDKLTLMSQIREQYDGLRSLYTELRKASGYRTKVYALGYPQIISKENPAKCGANIGFLNDKERTMIYEATTYLNLVIERAANAAGVKYVDISDALNGGRLCDDGQKYMTGLVRDFGQESMHPNHSGHTKIAEKVRSYLCNKSLRTYEVSDSGKKGCPVRSSLSDKPPIPGVVDGSETKKSSNTTITESIIAIANNFTIKIPPGLLRGQTNFRVTLHSDPIDLGVYATDSQGGAELEIAMPSSVNPGYHTLFIHGVSLSGEEIELTDSIVVHGQDPLDLDGNGIRDDTQVCGLFVPVSGLDGDMDGIDDACDPYFDEATTLTEYGDVDRPNDLTDSVGNAHLDRMRHFNRPVELAYRQRPAWPGDQSQREERYAVPQQTTSTDSAMLRGVGKQVVYSQDTSKDDGTRVLLVIGAVLALIVIGVCVLGGYNKGKGKVG